MKFIKSVLSLMNKVTWPTKKEAAIDFAGVIEYSAFFLLIIFVFDKLIKLGITSVLSLFVK
ncbi:preprotein translocase subunit SecE [Streptococcaceae bacterium ESL0729]|nr:preprotein translocase subunit SecE [Streptococcaceae bacterium ESL0729]